LLHPHTAGINRDIERRNTEKASRKGNREVRKPKQHKEKRVEAASTVAEIAKSVLGSKRRQLNWQRGHLNISSDMPQ
tara:strand:- start:238 stop:468 length:231 start_codon:yes stop_codon:yes gene_type:complete